MVQKSPEEQGVNNSGAETEGWLILQVHTHAVGSRLHGGQRECSPAA